MVIFTVGNCAHVAILDWFQKNVAIPNPGATTKSLVRQDSVLPKPGSICSTCAQILARFARLDSTFPKPGPITKNCGALRFSTKTFAVQRNDGSKERRQKGRCTGGTLSYLLRRNERATETGNRKQGKRFKPCGFHFVCWQIVLRRGRKIPGKWVPRLACWRSRKYAGASTM